MAFLNLTEEDVIIQRDAHPKFETQLTVKLRGKELDQLKVGLTDLLLAASGGGSTSKAELRVDFPQKWTVFWKIRESETRLLLAHPDQDSWVGTVSLTIAHCEALVQRLEQEGDLNPVVVSTFGPTSRMGNLEVIIVPVQG